MLAEGALGHFPYSPQVRLSCSSVCFEEDRLVLSPDRCKNQSENTKGMTWGMLKALWAAYPTLPRWACAAWCASCNSAPQSCETTGRVTSDVAVRVRALADQPLMRLHTSSEACGASNWGCTLQPPRLQETGPQSEASTVQERQAPSCLDPQVKIDEVIPLAFITKILLQVMFQITHLN